MNPTPDHLRQEIEAILIAANGQSVDEFLMPHALDQLLALINRERRKATIWGMNWAQKQMGHAVRGLNEDDMLAFYDQMFPPPQ